MSMPLDREARQMLERVSAAGIKRPHELSVADARQASRDRLQLYHRPSEPVARVVDITVPGSDGDLPGRLYAPSQECGLAILVYFHGGGWVLGDLETSDAQCRALANQAGCLVVAAGYRCAPEYKFPAAVMDAYATTRWVATNADVLGGDAARIAVGGDSAGGNLAAVVALIARDQAAFKLSFQLLVYPVVDYGFDTLSYQENGDGYHLTRADMQWFWRHYLRNEVDGCDYRASPLRATDLRGLPPAMVITAEFDPLRDEAEAYADRLRAAGIPVVCMRYPGMIHGFFGMGDAMRMSKVAMTDVAFVLRGVFGSHDERGA